MGSRVTLICQSYFERKILPHIVPSCVEKADVNQLLQLTAANNGKLSMSMYVKLDLDFFEIMVPKVGVLITQGPKELLDECQKTKLLAVIGWNFIKLADHVFNSKISNKEL